MSYELKMQGVGNGKRSRLYKKTKRASMNKIDATHLPMRVQSDKGGYWSQPSRGSVHISYSKFLQEGSKYAQIRSLQEIFDEFIIPNFTGYIPVYPDAGGTFVGIANKIREVNPDRKLVIYVTHMVNPKGITTLSENYDEVYFPNSYADWDEYMKLPDNVRIIKVV